MGRVIAGAVAVALLWAAPAQALDLVRVTADLPVAGTDCTFVLTDEGTASYDGRTTAYGVRGDDGRCVTPLGTCVDDYETVDFHYTSDRGCSLALAGAAVECYDRLDDAIFAHEREGACGLTVGEADVGCESTSSSSGGGIRWSGDSVESCGVAVGGSRLAGCTRTVDYHTYFYGEERACGAAEVSWTCSEWVSFYSGASGGTCVLRRPGAPDETFCTDPVYVQGYLIPTGLRRCE